eukprot:503645_1
MGTVFSKKKKINAKCINISDQPKLVMRIIIYHWIRQHQIRMFSDDIINDIIISHYLYQTSFEKESQIEKYKPEKHIPNDNTRRNYDYLFKLILLGDSGVGKSSLLCQWEEYSCWGNNFVSTIGIDFKYRTVEFDGIRVKCQIWDPAGQERFRTITSAYYRNVHGVLLVYDITNEESIKNIHHWKSEINKYGTIPTSENVLLVGNKLDLETQRVTSVTNDELNVSKIAKQCNIYHMIETSAKQNTNVFDALIMLCKQILNPKTTLQEIREIHPFAH